MKNINAQYAGNMSFPRKTPLMYAKCVDGKMMVFKKTNLSMRAAQTE